MKKVMITVLMLIGSQAHAGFQWGLLCKDTNQALYIFSDGYAGGSLGREDFANATICVSGPCDPRLMATEGGSFPRGFEEVIDEAFSTIAGANLTKEVREGVELVCGDRRLLIDVESALADHGVSINQ